MGKRNTRQNVVETEKKRHTTKNDREEGRNSEARQLSGTFEKGKMGDGWVWGKRRL